MRLVEVHGVSKLYQKQKSTEKVHAVRHVSFSVDKCEIVGLLGPNGAGKTSTIKMLCGLLRADQGSIHINGFNIEKDRQKALQHISAVLEGNRNLYWRMTVRENLEYFAGNRGYSRKHVAEKIDRLLEQFNLKHKEHELVSGLSRGMQQKLAIAIALLAHTDVILLDEPTLGLDVEVSHELRQLLKVIAVEEKRTIIISSHDMPVIQELCDRVIIINNGEVIVDDRVEQLLKLFESRAYALTLSEKLDLNLLSLVQKLYPLSTYSNVNHESILKVNLEHSQDIYGLFDLLKSERINIECIDRVSIDFEQVFMRIVKGGGLNAVGERANG